VRRAWRGLPFVHPSSERLQVQELDRRVAELTQLLDDALVTLGRTGRELQRLNRDGHWNTALPGASDQPSRLEAGSVRASVIIITYNRAASLRECLGLLRALDHPVFEVVVVNGPSTDDSQDVLDEWAGSIKVVDCPVANIAAARNLGLANAAGEVVAFLDDDTYPDPAWLTNLLAALLERPETAGAGGPYRDRSGTALEFVHLVGDRLGETTRIDSLDPSLWYATPFSSRFLILPGGNSAYRRETLVQIGGFDEAFEYGGEEGDVGIRLRDAGYLLRPAPAAIVYHQRLSNADRSDAGVMRSRYRYLRSKAYFARKHGPPFFTAREIEASNRRVADRFRLERGRSVEAGRLPAESLAEFEREAERALLDAEALWEDRASLVREPGWFAQAGAFLAFPHRPAGPDKQHVCVVVGRRTGVGAALPADLEALASEGHVVRLMRVVRADSRVTSDRGIWRHDIRAADDGHQRLAAEVQRLHAERQLTSIETAGLPASWSQRVQDLVPTA
jgi:glycogen synthase